MFVRKDRFESGCAILKKMKNHVKVWTMDRTPWTYIGT